MSSHSSEPAVTSATPAPSSSPPTTAAAATTTSPASPTSTTANTPSSSSSSTSATATPGSSAATSTQSSSSTTPAAQTSQTVVSSGGVVQTITQVITPTVTTTSSPETNSSSSNSFFNNTGAVAGVFTVVGIVALGLVIALIINCVRRRRAQKFDRDVAQAAAEAAASSRSPFDDYSYNNTGSGGGGGGGGGDRYGYSGDSHGTYQLPPMQPNDTYGMSEMSQYDPYAAGAASLAAAAAIDRSRSRKDSEPGAPGIAGVGARGLAREPSKHAPYHAFAGPASPPPHELQGSSGTMRGPRGTNQDILEAVGLAGPNSGPYPSPPLNPNINTINNNNSNNNSAGAYVTRKPSETTQHTHVSRQSHFGSVNSHHPTTLQPGRPVIDSYYPQRHDSHSPDPFAGYPPQVMPVSTTTLPNPHDTTLPSPSLPGHSDHNEEYGEPSSPEALRSEEQRMSYQDDGDYSQGNRILRVANE